MEKVLTLLVGFTSQLQVATIFAPYAFLTITHTKHYSIFDLLSITNASDEHEVHAIRTTLAFTILGWLVANIFFLRLWYNENNTREDRLFNRICAFVIFVCNIIAVSVYGSKIKLKEIIYIRSSWELDDFFVAPILITISTILSFAIFVCAMIYPDIETKIEKRNTLPITEFLAQFQIAAFFSPYMRVNIFDIHVHDSIFDLLSLNGNSDETKVIGYLRALVSFVAIAWFFSNVLFLRTWFETKTKIDFVISAMLCVLNLLGVVFYAVEISGTKYNDSAGADEHFLGPIFLDICFTISLFLTCLYGYEMFIK